MMKPHIKVLSSAVYPIQCTQCMYIPLIFHTCIVVSSHNNEYREAGGYRSPVCNLVSDIYTHNHWFSFSAEQEGSIKSSGHVLSGFRRL